jgi:hypothetical protein
MPPRRGAAPNGAALGSPLSVYLMYMPTESEKDAEPVVGIAVDAMLRHVMLPGTAADPAEVDEGVGRRLRPRP